MDPALMARVRGASSVVRNSLHRDRRNQSIVNAENGPS
jgi:hypothetical protein